MTEVIERDNDKIVIDSVKDGNKEIVIAYSTEQQRRIADGMDDLRKTGRFLKKLGIALSVIALMVIVSAIVLYVKLDRMNVLSVIGK